MVEGADEQIVRIKSKKANSILAKLVNEASNAIYIRLRDRNYPALVKILIGLQDNIDDWKKQMQQKNSPDIDKQVHRAQKEIEKCVKELLLNYD